MNLQEKLVADRKKLSEDIDLVIIRLDEYSKTIEKLAIQLEIAKEALLYYIEKYDDIGDYRISDDFAVQALEEIRKVEEDEWLYKKVESQDEYFHPHKFSQGIFTDTGVFYKQKDETFELFLTRVFNTLMIINRPVNETKIHIDFNNSSTGSSWITVEYINLSKE